MILLVTYDLKSPGKDYSAVHATLKTAGGWWHYLESTWVLATDEGVDSWTEKLLKVVDKTDNFLIVDITNKSRQGWLPEKAWEWLRNHDGGISKV